MNKSHFLWNGLIVGLVLFGLSGCKAKEDAAVIGQNSSSGLVSSVSPAAGTASIAVAGNLEITFPQAMSSSSLTVNGTDNSCSGSVQLSVDNFTTCVILGTPTLDNTGAVATIAYTGLTNATTYKAKVTTSATTSGGSALGSEYAWSFITISATAASNTPSSTKALTGFSFTAAGNGALSVDVTGTITGSNITLSLPYVSSVAALVPTFSTTGSSVTVGGVAQTSGTSSQNFSSAVTYTVTAADSTTQTYSVTVTVGSGTTKALSAFRFTAAANSALSSDVTGTITGTNIAVSLPYVPSVTALIPSFNTTGASVKVGGTSQTSGTSSQNFSSAVTYTVTALDNTTQAYTVTVTVPLNPAKAITAFGFTAAGNGALSADVTGTITGTAIAAPVPFGTTVTALVPTFTTTGVLVTVAASTQTSGASSQDFSSAVTYIVTASDSTTQTYTVTAPIQMWRQEAYIKATNGEAGDQFGTFVSLDADTLAVGVHTEGSSQTTITNGTTASADNLALQSGAVYVYKRTGTTWAQEAYLKAVNAGANDWFGIQVSLEADTLVVGASEEASNQTTITNGTTASADNSIANSGAVYVYKRTGTSWAQEAYIKAVNAGSDQFGRTVSLSVDTLAVGAILEASSQTTITNGTTASADNTFSQAGAVYVYKRSGTSWAPEAYIKAANAGSNDQFGTSVSLSVDTLAVGVPLEDSNQSTITNGSTANADNMLLDSGAVYVYKRSGTNWAQEAYIKVVNARATDWFGKSINLDTDTLAVGSTGEDTAQTSITNGTTGGTNTWSSSAGAVFVYKRTGSNWAQEAYIKASNAGTNDFFGTSVSLSTDTLAVGALYEDSSQTTITNGTTSSVDNTVGRSGAVFVYKRTGTSWAQEAYIKASNGEAGDLFGNFVSLSAGTLAVGVPLEDSNQTTITNGTTASADNTATDSGAVYIYRYK